VFASRRRDDGSRVSSPETGLGRPLIELEKDHGAELVADVARVTIRTNNISRRVLRETMSSMSLNRHQTTRLQVRYCLSTVLAGCLVWSFVNQCCAQDSSETVSGSVQQETRLGVIHFFEPQVWGAKTVKLSNSSSKTAEIITGGYFDGAPLNRYMRQVTLPPETERLTQIRVLPTANEEGVIEWHSLMYSVDDTAGTLMRASDEFIVDAEELAEPPERLTAVIADFRESGPDEIHRIVELAAATRVAMGRTRRLIQMEVEDIPVEANGLDVVDEIILCSNRIADDPARLVSLRAWVEQGGHLWIQLDQIDVSTVTHLLGEVVQLQPVDEVGLTQVQLDRVDLGEGTGEALEFDYPVRHIRMMVDGVNPLHNINGWPASFTAAIGRGTVLFTTLSQFAWVRERTSDEPKGDPESYSDFVARRSLVELAARWTVESDPMPVIPTDFQPLLATQVGYRIPSRQTILTALWLFCGVLLGAGLWLRRKKTEEPQNKKSGALSAIGRKSEQLAVIGPALALLTAVPIVVMGQSSRSAIPASISVSEFVQVNPATSTLRSTGTAAIFVPDTEVVDLAASQGRILLPPTDESTGTLRQMVQTDFGQSEWSDLSVNTGLQFFATSQNRPLDLPINATVQFGPDGASGQLQTGLFSEPEDVLIASRAADVLAVQVEQDAGFTAGFDETLAPGAYVSSSMLSDQQVTRQELYRSLFSAGTSSRYPREPVLLAWMRPENPYVICPDGFDANHSAVVAVPLTYETTPPGTEVMIPSPFLTFDAVLTQEAGQSTAYDNRTATWRESLQSGRTVLRVNIPDSVKPLRLNQVNIELKLLASSHSVSLFAGQRESPAEVASMQDAAGTYQWTLAESDQLQIDSDGDYYVHLDVQPSGNGEVGADSNKAWEVDFLRLEMLGRTIDTEKQTETVNE